MQTAGLAIGITFSVLGGIAIIALFMILRGESLPKFLRISISKNKKIEEQEQYNLENKIRLSTNYKKVAEEIIGLIDYANKRLSHRLGKIDISGNEEETIGNIKRDIKRKILEIKENLNYKELTYIIKEEGFFDEVFELLDKISPTVWHKNIELKEKIRKIKSNELFDFENKKNEKNFTNM